MTSFRLSTTAFRVIFVGFIVIASLQTLASAAGFTGQAPKGLIVALASVEIAAALAFMMERWRMAATLVLVLVFATAMALSAIAGELALRFVYFASTALYLSTNAGPQRQNQK
jgi:hypothetical protein